MTYEDIWLALNSPFVPAEIPEIELREGQAYAEFEKTAKLTHLEPGLSDEEYRKQGLFPELAKARKMAAKICSTFPEDDYNFSSWYPFTFGKVQCRSLKTGNICVSWHSFQAFRTTFYRFVENGEVFYLTCTLSGYRTFYYPMQNLVVHDHPLFAGAQHSAAFRMSLNRFKEMCIRSCADVKQYLRDEGKKPLALFLGCRHFAHHLYNELPGLERVVSSKAYEKFSKIVVTEQSYGPISEIFPEFPAEKVVQCGNDYEAFRACLGYFIIRTVTHKTIPESLISRVKLTAKRLVSEEEQLSAKEAQKTCFPLVWMNLRYQGRGWVGADEGIANIVEALHVKYPKIGLILDGYSYPWGTGGHLRRYIEKEKEGVERIRKLLTTVPIFDIVGKTLPENVIWAEVADVFFCSHGSNDHKVSWIRNCPGLLHGPIGRMRLGSVSAPRENIKLPECLKAAEINEQENRSYTIDWKVAYGKLLKIIDAIPQR